MLECDEYTHLCIYCIFDHSTDRATTFTVIITITTTSWWEFWKIDFHWSATMFWSCCALHCGRTYIIAIIIKTLTLTLNRIGPFGTPFYNVIKHTLFSTGVDVIVIVRHCEKMSSLY